MHIFCNAKILFLLILKLKAFNLLWFGILYSFLRICKFIFWFLSSLHWSCHKGAGLNFFRLFLIVGIEFEAAESRTCCLPFCFSFCQPVSASYIFVLHFLAFGLLVFVSHIFSFTLNSLAVSISNILFLRFRFVTCYTFYLFLF